MGGITAVRRVRRAVDGDLGRTVGGLRPRWTEAFAPDLSPGWTPVVHHYTGIRPRAHRRPSTELSPDVGEPVVVCERSATETGSRGCPVTHGRPARARQNNFSSAAWVTGPATKGGRRSTSARTASVSDGHA